MEKGVNAEMKNGQQIPNPSVDGRNDRPKLEATDSRLRGNDGGEWLITQVTIMTNNK